MILKSSLKIGIGIILLSQFVISLLIFYPFSSNSNDKVGNIDIGDNNINNSIMQDSDLKISPSEAIFASLSIKIYDIDMGPLEQAKAHISGKDVNFYAVSNIEGQITFTNLQLTTYDLLITYVSSMGSEEIFNGQIKMNKTQEEIILNTNVRQVYFEIVDIDGVKMNTGAVTVYETDWTDPNHTDLMLDAEGQTKFIGIERTESNPYYYEVSYINYFYTPAITSLVKATLHHKPLTSYTYSMGENSIDLGEGNFLSSMRYYAEGSNSEKIGSQKINQISISISSILDGYIWKVEIYGVNKYGQEEVLEICESEFLGQNTHTWNFKKELWNCGREYYGIHIKSFTYHLSGICSGEVQSTIHEIFKEKVIVSMSSCQLIVLDTDGLPVDGATVKIYNDSTDYDTIITSLTTDKYGVALDNNGNNFWYLSECYGSIHISYCLEILCFGSIIPFSVFECGDQALINFNFSINIHMEITFSLTINMNQYRTEIIPIETETKTKYNYRDTISLTIQTGWIDQCDICTPFEAESISFSLMDINQQILYINDEPTLIDIGIYDFSFIPEQICLQIDDNLAYIIKITAHTPGYGADPAPFMRTIQINPIACELKILKANKEVEPLYSLYWGEKLNFEILFRDSQTQLLISDAKIHLYASWDKSTDIILANKGDNGYYSIMIDSRNIGQIGIFFIQISASKENYAETDLVQIGIKINLIPIQPYFGLAKFSDIVHYQAIQENIIEIKIKLEDPVNNIPISDANVKMKLDSFSTPFNFIESSTGIYELDIDTSQIDAFYQQQSLTGILSVEKENYTPLTTGVELLVLMPEITPGVPKFYFYIGVGAISLPIAAVAGTKIVQYARIPTHTKRIRKMEDIIQKNKPMKVKKFAISSNEDFIQKHNKAWKAVGLDLTKTPKKFSTPKDQKGGL